MMIQRQIQQEMDRRKKQETLLIASITAVVALVVILGIFFAINIISERNAAEALRIQQEEEIAAAIAAAEEARLAYNPFDTVALGARGAYIFDVNTQAVLFEKNAQKIFPIASITKVMTALTAYEVLDKDALVQISWQDTLTEGESGLIPGEHFRMSDIVDFMLIASSNDAAAAIATVAGNTLIAEKNLTGTTPHQAFIAAMNSLANTIGMEQSTFANPTGLDEQFETLPGATATPQDIARMFTYAIETYPGMLEATQSQTRTINSREGYVHNITNTNEILKTLPNTIASKTGYTIQAGGNLAVVIDPGLNNPIIIVALGSTLAGRFSDVTTLANTTLEYLVK